MSTVNLRNCTEELLKYTIQSRISETLEFDIGLSEDFCSRLLNSDPCDDPFPASHSTDSMEGVPPHPLYKHLAYALQQSMTSGTFYRTYNRMPMIGTENSLKQKEHFWQKLISEKGSEFVNQVLRTIDLELYVEEPFFSQMKDGLKTIEGRCATGKYSRIKSGSLILLNECLLFEVQDVHWYASFSKMLEAEGLAEVLPGVKSIIEDLVSLGLRRLGLVSASSTIFAFSCWCGQPSVVLNSLKRLTAFVRHSLYLRSTLKRTTIRRGS